MKYKYIAVILITLFISFGAGLFLWKRLKNTKHPVQIKQIVKQAAPLPKEVTVTLDKNGFSPKEVMIASGIAVRWENTTRDKQTVNSDNYPTNQLHKELNFGIINSGSSVVYIFKTPGIYGYHNQFHPQQKGKIIVSQ